MNRSLAVISTLLIANSICAEVPSPKGVLASSIEGKIGEARRGQVEASGQIVDGQIQGICMNNWRIPSQQELKKIVDEEMQSGVVVQVSPLRYDAETSNCFGTLELQHSRSLEKSTLTIPTEKQRAKAIAAKAHYQNYKRKRSMPGLPPPPPPPSK